MIIRGSRYDQAVLVRIRQADRTSQFAVYTGRPLTWQTFDYTNRTLVAGERLDTLAAQVYGNALLWWVIARANPEILYPDNIPPGTVLRIPSATAIR